MRLALQKKILCSSLLSLKVSTLKMLMALWKLTFNTSIKKLRWICFLTTIFRIVKKKAKNMKKICVNSSFCSPFSQRNHLYRIITIIKSTLLKRWLARRLSPSHNSMVHYWHLFSSSDQTIIRLFGTFKDCDFEEIEDEIGDEKVGDNMNK